MGSMGSKRRDAEMYASENIGGDGDAEIANADTGKLTFAELALIFLVLSFLGLIGESIVSFFQDGFWKNRAGLLWGPFSPIYGLGAVILTAVLYPVRKKNPLLVFLLSAVVGASFEWIAGAFFEQAFGIVAWSYAGQWGNLGDHTSLPMAVVWGLLGLLWIKLGYPVLARLAHDLPERASRIATWAVAVFFVVDAACTLVAFDCWYQRAAGEAPASALEQFFADCFDDDYMARRFETMTVWPDLANR